MKNVRFMLAVSLLGVGIPTASLLSAPTDGASPASKMASLEKQIESLQAALDALKAKIALHDDKAEDQKVKPDEAVGHGYGRRRGPGFGGAMMRRRFRPGMMRSGEGPPEGFRGPGAGFVKRFDKDGDNKVSADEFPRGKDAFDRALRFLDKDGDGLLGDEEVAAVRRGPRHKADDKPCEAPGKGLGGAPGCDAPRGPRLGWRGGLGRGPGRPALKPSGPGRPGIVGRGPGLRGRRGIGLGHYGMIGRGPGFGGPRGYAFGRRGMIGRGPGPRGFGGFGSAPKIGRFPRLGGMRGYGLGRRGMIGRPPRLHLRGMGARRYGPQGLGFGLGRW